MSATLRWFAAIWQPGDSERLPSGADAVHLFFHHGDKIKTEVGVDSLADASRT